MHASDEKKRIEAELLIVIGAMISVLITLWLLVKR
jgi:hypothetical protein